MRIGLNILLAGGLVTRHPEVLGVPVDEIAKQVEMETFYEGQHKQLVSPLQNWT